MYALIRIDQEMIQAFKTAIVAISVWFSIQSIYIFFVFGGPNPSFAAKDLVGSQRFGFIYLMALSLTYFYVAQKPSHLLVKYSFFFIILAGLFLTFSRSSIVSLVGSLVLFTLTNALAWFGRPSLGGLRKAVVSVPVALIMIVGVYELFPITFDFFKVRLVDLLSDRTSLIAALNDPTYSEGGRVFLGEQTFKFVMANPLTGSGYLGVWVLQDVSNNLMGSAHNQYLDVLFRTGILGFGIYLSLLFYLLKKFYSSEPALFWGLVGVLIYGMFHETFKESQGTFLLTFLLGMASQSYSGLKFRLSLQEGLQASVSPARA
jgi:O-antigen ligase